MRCLLANVLEVFVALGALTYGSLAVARDRVHGPSALEEAAQEQSGLLRTELHDQETLPLTKDGAAMKAAELGDNVFQFNVTQAQEVHHQPQTDNRRLHTRLIHGENATGDNGRFDERVIDFFQEPAVGAALDQSALNFFQVNETADHSSKEQVEEKEAIKRLMRRETSVMESSRPEARRLGFDQVGIVEESILQWPLPPFTIIFVVGALVFGYTLFLASVRRMIPIKTETSEVEVARMQTSAPEELAPVTVFKHWLPSWLVEDDCMEYQRVVRKSVEAMSVCRACDLDTILPLASGYDCAILKPLCSKQLLRLEARVSGPTSHFAPFAAPFSGKACVLYSATVTRKLHQGIHAVTVAFAQNHTDFVVTLADRASVRVELMQEEVSLFDMKEGEVVESCTLADVPHNRKQFMQEHETVPIDAAPGHEVFEFRECALRVGAVVTLVGELIRNPSGQLSLRPMHGHGSHKSGVEPWHTSWERVEGDGKSLSSNELEGGSEDEAMVSENTTSNGVSTKSESPQQPWARDYPRGVLLSDDPALLSCS